MIHLVLPMAGRGTRFLTAGYTTPKPLIDVGGWRMFELVLANLWSPLVTQITLVCQAEVADRIDTSFLASKLNAEIRLKVLTETTNGAATTVALALGERESSPPKPLIVANTDQYLDMDMSSMIRGFVESGDHLIVGMEATDDKWSFVRLDNKTKKVSLVREKEPISNYATCGIYMFSSEDDFLSGYQRMRDAQDFTNGELYVAPVYNYLEAGSTSYVNLGTVESLFHGLGTPQDLDKFLDGPQLHKALAQARRVFS